VNLLFIFLIIILLITEWIQRDKAHVLQIQHIRYIGLRWGIYSGLLIATLVFISTGDPAAKGFIYVKF
jgi:hypothetical protein